MFMRNEMDIIFQRKILTALITSAIAIVMLNILEPIPSSDGGWMLGILVYTIYSVPVVFIYGILCSIIADRISIKRKKFKKSFSFVLHVLFGAMFIIPYGIFLEFDSSGMVLGIIFSIVFYLVDVILNKLIKFN